MDAPAINTPEYSVSELAHALKRTVEDSYGHVRVRGEISGFKRAASGHVYLSLKDDAAVIDGVMWKGVAGALPFRPEDGLEVIATGKLTTYPGRSKYQIVIERMEPAGVGALLAQLEARKAKLAAEGLFDADRKRALPYIPRVIGVITSPTGAVIRDILHRLADRFPRPVLVWPVLVQGDAAAGQVAAAIAGFNALPRGGPIPRPDLLIVARGGGSIEDLWAFNEEVTVRAVADSRIPIITAVGHETDTTLVDFASDHRAPTPTAAAERAVPVLAELRLTLTGLGLRADRAALRLLDLRRERLTAVAARQPSLRNLLGLRQQRFDELAERLPRGLRATAQHWATRLTRAQLRPLLLRQHRDRAAADIAGGAVPRLHFDVIHAHDWQAGMALAYQRFAPAGPQLPSVMTTHNMAFQGHYGADLFAALGLPPVAMAIDGIEYHGGISFLKAGLAAASRITTVSPTYAREIREPGFGMGLEGLIRGREADVSGIVNGIDTAVWNPASDPALKATYTAKSLGRRAANKRALEAEFGLEAGDGPLFIVISRLTWQKGMDVLLQALDHLVGNGARLERINWLGDVSEKGLAESAGVMVNYLYDLATIERLTTPKDRYAI